MASHIFYPSKKTIRTKTTAYIKPDFLVALEDYQVWICFSDGTWILYDALNSKNLYDGKFFGDLHQLTDVIQCPRALNKNQIVYANCSNLKLEVINVKDGTHDTTWTGETPTLEGLPIQMRSDASKVSECFNDLKIEVLKNSQLIGVFERREVNEATTDYLLTIYEQGKKHRLAQVISHSQQKQYSLAKGNEDNLFVLWSPYHDMSFSFLLLDAKKPNEGFVTINIQLNIKTTLVHCFPWSKGTISFYGNADSSGINEQYVYDLKKENELKTIQMKYYPEGVDSLMTDVVDTDPVGGRIVLTEFADDHNIVLYDVNSEEAFTKRQEEESLYTMSHDKKFIVEYDAVLAAEEDPHKPSETRINVLRVVNKTMIVLFFMKYAKSRSGVNFLHLYGDPYIAKNVAEMFF